MARVIVMPDPNDPGFKGRVLRFFIRNVLWLSLLLFLVLLVSKDVYTVPSDSRGIVLRFGQVSSVRAAGAASEAALRRRCLHDRVGPKAEL